METSYCLGEQTLILCLDTKQGFSWLPLASISSINATHVWIYDSVKQPKKQWEIFHIIISCRGGFREGSVFWPELKDQSRSPWGTQTGLAGAIFLLCISCVESYLKNFQLFFFFLLENANSWKSTSFMGICCFFKYFHCAEEQKANGDDKVKECSDISFQACQL